MSAATSRPAISRTIVVLPASVGPARMFMPRCSTVSDTSLMMLRPIETTLVQSNLMLRPSRLTGRAFRSMNDIGRMCRWLPE